MEKKVDRRVKYTKKAIRDSFLSLLQEKPLEKISVTEICQRADINRGTFYSHYSDPYDLKTSLENELVEKMQERVEELGVSHLTSSQSFELLKENRELCRIFFGPNGDIEALIKIIKNQTDAIFSSESLDFLNDLPAHTAKHLKGVVVSATTAVIKYWFDSDMVYEPKVVAEFLDRFCSKGLCGFTE